MAGYGLLRASAHIPCECVDSKKSGVHCISGLACGHERDYPPYEVEVDAPIDLDFNICGCIASTQSLSWARVQHTPSLLPFNYLPLHVAICARLAPEPAVGLRPLQSQWEFSTVLAGSALMSQDVKAYWPAWKGN